jgi:DNA-binding GntR family transcriptional regulator
MFVTKLSTEDVQKINSVRIILETEALKLARARMIPSVAAELYVLERRVTNQPARFRDGKGGLYGMFHSRLE